MRKSAIVSIAVLMLAGAGCLSISTPAVPTIPPLATAGPKPTVTPMPPVPAETTIADHRKAMRAGFEDEVDAYADGQRYWVTLDIQTEPVRVKGHEKLHYVNRTGQTLNDAVFRLFLNGLGDDQVQDISAVTVDGESLELAESVQGSVVTAALPSALAPDAAIDFEIDFTVALDPGLSVTYGRVLDLDGEINLSSFLPLIGVYGASGWVVDAPVPQGDPAYSEVALFDILVTVPTDYKIASSGVVVGQTKNTNGTTQYAIASGPVRDISVAISKEFTLLSDIQDGITVNVWSLPDAKPDANQDALAKAEAALTVYNESFGPYPFSEFDVINSPITAGGIEYPGLVYIASNTWDTSAFFFEVVIAHETAHQWWYSMVGDDQINEPWLDESLAQYSLEVYYASLYGDEAGRAVRETYQGTVDSYLSVKGNPNMPIGMPVAAYNERQYSVFVYNKGPLFYSQLADKYGDAAVLKMLKTYFTQYRYRIARSSDMQRLVTEMLGPDARELFDQMVQGS